MRNFITNFDAALSVSQFKIYCEQNTSPNYVGYLPTINIFTVT